MCIRESDLQAVLQVTRKKTKLPQEVTMTPNISSTNAEKPESMLWHMTSSAALAPKVKT
jgi:hypothetical protein